MSSHPCSPPPCATGHMRRAGISPVFSGGYCMSCNCFSRDRMIQSILTPKNHIVVYLCSGVLRLAGRDERCIKCILTKEPALMSETNIRGNKWFFSSCTCRKKRCCSTPGKECPQQCLPEIVRVWVQVQGQCQGCWFPPLRDQLMLCDPGILPELLLPHEHRAECLVR